MRRDRSGEAADPVYSILPGRIVHVSAVSGHSNYGRYVVVERRSHSHFCFFVFPSSTIAEGVMPGVRVGSGTILGVMGRSAGGYSIPKSRAHLHFEIGFYLTDGFQGWYDRQAFEDPNRHGKWNGMNLVGIDPLAFYEAMHSGRVDGMKEHLATLPVVARIRVFSRKTPDFVLRYPALVSKPAISGQVIAWDIAFTPHGLPLQWTPHFASEGLSGQPGDVQVLAYQSRSCGSSRVIEFSISLLQAKISQTTLSQLKKLFGFR